jgi:hypothetical protein
MSGPALRVAADDASDATLPVDGLLELSMSDSPCHSFPSASRRFFSSRAFAIGDTYFHGASVKRSRGVPNPLDFVTGEGRGVENIELGLDRISL